MREMYGVRLPTPDWAALPKTAKYARPPNGAVIRVVSRHQDCYAFAEKTYKDITNEGTVLMSNQWDEAGTFNLNASIPHFIPNIAMINVISLQIKEGDKWVEGKLVLDVPPDITFSVIGSKGDPYTVKRTDGMWSCTCPGFTFRKTECKHIKAKKSDL